MSSSQPSSESHLTSDEGGASQQEQRKGKEAPIDANPLAESHDKEMSQQGKPKELRPLMEVSGPVRLASVVSIFRVPNFLKGSKTAERGAYVPERVSLGPYHHTKPELRPMDPHKRKALCRMKTRFNNSAVKEIEFCHSAVKEIEKLEKAIRDSYEETIEYHGETLARMLSLDGSFVLEILRTLKGEFDEPHQACKYYEPIFEFDKISNTGLDILNDILKLENQIPWIVLQKLLQLELNSTENDARKKLQQLIVGDTILSKICPFDFKDDQSPRLPDEADHLLGFLHSFIVSPPHDPHEINIRIKCCCRGEKNKNKEKCMDNLPRAVELSDAGIKFQSRTRIRETKFDRDTRIREIKFDRDTATIYLPRITISDHTEVLFRNLIAFEMCKPCEASYVADYVYLMDRLIDSEKDVSLLRRMGIVRNMLGSDKEVAELFNGLCKGVAVGDDVFKGLIPEVIDHYSSKTKVQFAQFLEKYLSSPWKAAALVGAIFALLFSAAQTIILIIMLQ